MNKYEAGFTLIELMIVVAIIGILAAIAIPSYQDYTARAQVSEALSLTSGFKTALSEYYSDNGTFPTLAVIGGTSTGKYVDNIVFNNVTGGTLAVTATFRTSGISAQIAGDTFTLATEDGGKSWQCGADQTLYATNQVSITLMPSACKP